MDLIQFSLRLGAAILAGALIGLERQWHQKSAGLRTNTLVAMGSALYVMLSLDLTAEMAAGDVTRVVGQVVVGVGFLGAGVILHQGMDVQGLTTAATIWCSAAIGSLAGAGYFAEAGIGTLAILFVNSLFMRIDHWLKYRRSNTGSSPPAA
jgi:putative Mg2+ transporter-C (MgtC) family protein